MTRIVRGLGVAALPKQVFGLVSVPEKRRHLALPIVSFSIILVVLLSISSVNAQTPGGVPLLGIDCGLGSTVQTGNFNPPFQPTLIGDSFLDTTCSWIGDVDSDGVQDPLVSDPTTFDEGGGFTAEIRVADMDPTDNISYFDIILSFDNRYLSAVMIDQRGLRFGESDVFDLVRTIDNNAGQVRLVQAILGGFESPDINNGLTLFRLRFDVVGVGTSPLTIHADSSLIDISGVPLDHKKSSGSFENTSLLDPSVLGWDVSWVFSPGLPVPGSSLTFTATALCPGCGGTLNYIWDTDSVAGDPAPTDELGGNPVEVTAPPPIIHRVTLKVDDLTGNFVSAVRRLPLAIAVSGPSSVAGDGANSWTGKVLGGVPHPLSGGYAGVWRFCPGTQTPLVSTVCTAPNPSSTAAALADQIDSKTVTYKWSGVFTNTFRVTESTPSWLQTGSPPASVSVTATFLVAVTGKPQAYIVTVANVAQGTTGAAVSIAARIRYPGDGAVIYDTDGGRDFDSGETVLTGAAPSVGIPLRDDPKIKYRDLNGNSIRDGTECVFYDDDNDNVVDPGEAIAGTCPGSGTVKDDPRLRYVDTNGNNVYDHFTSYPGAFRSNSFGVTFNFGDGTSAAVSGGQTNCAINPPGICTLTTSHVYAVKGSYIITATAAETGGVAVSKIQESGTSIITISPPLFISLMFSPEFPTAGSSATFSASVTGGTSPYIVIWEFGDGVSTIGNPVTHVYSLSGVYPLTARATDANNATIESPPTLVTVARLIWSVTSNPTEGGDVANGIAADSSGLYAVGYDTVVYPDIEWRIEKRSLMDGSLIWAVTSNPSTGGEQAYGVAVDSSGVYVVGTDFSPGDSEWRVEKRSLTDGSLLWVATSNPSTGSDEAYGVAVDGSGVYTVGLSSLAGAGWRMEKRNLAEGSLVWSATSQGDLASGVAVDSSGVYAIGTVDGRAGVKLEKRSLSDGNLTWSAAAPAFCGCLNPAVAIDGSGAYIAGFDSSSGWGVEKRSLTDGSLLWGAEAFAGGNPFGIAVDGSGAYAVGFASFQDPMDPRNTLYAWRAEKRNLADGSLLWDVTESPSAFEIATGVAVDASGVYIAGFARSPSADYEWRIEKRPTEMPPTVTPIGLASANVVVDELGNTIISGFGPSGNLLAQAVLPQGSSFPTGNVFVAYLPLPDGDSFFQIAGVTVPYPPGKSVLLRSGQLSDFVCIVDMPATLVVTSIVTCDTVPPVSEVLLLCDGGFHGFAGFPDPPSVRIYRCEKLQLGGEAFMMVEGLAYSSVATVTVEVSVSKFFTDSNLNPLPVDNLGNPEVDVVLASGRVRSTNPGQILAWVNVTNTGSISLQSLMLNETLPSDWTVHPPWDPAIGAIHVYFVYANGTRLEITDPATVTVSTGDPETVFLSISNMTATITGKSLDPGESILLSVKVDYALKTGTGQTPSTYPRNYTDTASSKGWTAASFTGAQTSKTVSAFFTAYAKVVGDVNGDFKVDLLDIAIAGYAYGSRPGDARWNETADLDKNQLIDLIDLSTVAYNYGTTA